MIYTGLSRCGTGLEQFHQQFPKSASDSVQAPPEDYSLKGWQQLIPTLAAGGVGALYGASQAPGGSPLRGGIVGGLAGAGAGAAYTGANQFIASPYGKLLPRQTAATAAMLLGSGAIGGAIGLHGGRKLSDKLGLPDKDKDDELRELDLLQQAKTKAPTLMSRYFSL